MATSSMSKGKYFDLWPDRSGGHIWQALNSVHPLPPEQQQSEWVNGCDLGEWHSPFLYSLKQTPSLLAGWNDFLITFNEFVIIDLKNATLARKLQFMHCFNLSSSRFWLLQGAVVISYSVSCVKICTNKLPSFLLSIFYLFIFAGFSNGLLFATFHDIFEKMKLFRTLKLVGLWLVIWVISFQFQKFNEDARDETPSFPSGVIKLSRENFWGRTYPCRDLFCEGGKGTTKYLSLTHAFRAVVGRQIPRSTLTSEGTWQVDTSRSRTTQVGIHFAFVDVWNWKFILNKF